MSTYYQYSFISPESVYSIVKDELKSYFITGSIDDILFSTWTSKCLKRLNRGSIPIKETILHIDDFKDNTPVDFYAVREAWACQPNMTFPVKSPGAFYQQITTQVDSKTPDACKEPNCEPEVVYTVYKTNDYNFQSFTHSFLLKPGNISSSPDCRVQCKSPGESTVQSFDIRGSKFTTNFRDGWVHLIYYAEEQDESGNQLVPDNFRILEYIEAYLKYKCFEVLSNTVTDESYNQIQNKLQQYKQLSDEAFVIADTETKKETQNQKQRRVFRTINRNNMYQLAGTAWRRRNN